jgi:hypothetical protein
MKEFCCCAETANEAVSLLHATKDACPIVRILLPNWMHNPASCRLDGSLAGDLDPLYSEIKLIARSLQIAQKYVCRSARQLELLQAPWIRGNCHRRTARRKLLAGGP